MAVVSRNKGRLPKHYELVLEDGQIVNVMATRAGLSVADEREMTAIKREALVIAQRIAHLENEAIQAPDDRAYESKLRYAKKFQKNYADLRPKVTGLLLLTVTEWDLALTEEDEKAERFVDLTEAGLAQVEYDMLLDINSKLMDKFAEEDEKKELASESSPDSTAARASTEQSPTGT